jgi:RNA 2',3'-cyclic 3'-phosphodiesterase
MRLFIAIDLDDEARSAIAREQQRLAAVFGDSRRSSLKWVRPDHMHLTLVFLGEVDESRAAPLIADVGVDLPHDPFDVHFAGIGVFPPRGAPSVLWLGVAAGAETAVALQRTLGERVRPYGVTLDARPFHPHLTLARYRNSRPSDRQQVMTASRDESAGIATVHVAHVTLYQSRLSSTGPSYTVLVRANLRGG